MTLTGPVTLRLFPRSRIPGSRSLLIHSGDSPGSHSGRSRMGKNTEVTCQLPALRHTGSHRGGQTQVPSSDSDTEYPAGAPGGNDFGTTPVGESGVGDREWGTRSDSTDFRNPRPLRRSGRHTAANSIEGMCRIPLRRGYRIGTISRTCRRFAFTIYRCTSSLSTAGGRWGRALVTNRCTKSHRYFTEGEGRRQMGG